MKTLNFGGARYEAPQLSYLDIRNEGILCSSQGGKWYDQGGFGDFNYGTENDNTWA